VLLSCAGSQFYFVTKNLLFLGTNRVEVAKKARDIKFMHRMQNKNYMKLGTKANRLQTHFLDRNGMCM
jgi:hypothetical protein